MIPLFTPLSISEETVVLRRADYQAILEALEDYEAELEIAASRADPADQERIALEDVRAELAVKAASGRTRTRERA